MIKVEHVRRTQFPRAFAHPSARIERGNLSDETDFETRQKTRRGNVVVWKRETALLARIIREHVFGGDCESVATPSASGVTRPCATGSGRANTGTNPCLLHHRQHNHHRRCRTLSSTTTTTTTTSITTSTTAAVAPTTASTSTTTTTGAPPPSPLSPLPSYHHHRLLLHYHHPYNLRSTPSKVSTIGGSSLSLHLTLQPLSIATVEAAPFLLCRWNNPSSIPRCTR